MITLKRKPAGPTKHRKKGGEEETVQSFIHLTKKKSMMKKCKVTRELAGRSERKDEERA